MRAMTLTRCLSARSASTSRSEEPTLSRQLLSRDFVLDVISSTPRQKNLAPPPQPRYRRLDTAARSEPFARRRTSTHCHTFAETRK
jgi:hypothetical protein